MDMLSCVIMGENPQRFTFKYNEQAPLCRKLKAVLKEQIILLYEDGVRLFYVGCAVGVDTWAAEIILDLKQRVEFSAIELFCAIPFPEQADTFTAGQKKRYQTILESCAHKETISRHYSPVAYKRLHYYMIDNTQYFLAVYDQGGKGHAGLGQAANYAIKKGLKITHIHPDTAKVTKHF